MIAEAVELVEGWLEDGANGFNAIRSTIPLSAGWTAPPAVTVKTAIDTAWVAREQVDRDAITGPMLLVSGEIGPSFGFHPAKTREPKTDATVLVRYAARSATSHTLWLQAHLSLKVARRSIAKQVTGLLDGYSKNTVVFDVPTGEPLEMALSVEDDLVVGGFIVRFPASDPWSLGIG